MIYPKQNRLFKYVLHTYARWIIWRYFGRINYNTIAVDSDRSVLLVANHFSAWDAFILFWINRSLLGKDFHVLVLEETLVKHPMLKHGGAFSIKKSSRDVVTSLNYAAELLKDPRNLVVIYPQGKLYSNLVSDILFEKGIMHVMQKAGSNFDLLFAVTFVENFEQLKPTANVYLKVESPQKFSDIERLQHAYQQHYTASLQQQTQIVK